METVTAQACVGAGTLSHTCTSISSRRSSLKCSAILYTQNQRSLVPRLSQFFNVACFSVYNIEKLGMGLGTRLQSLGLLLVKMGIRSDTLLVATSHSDLLVFHT